MNNGCMGCLFFWWPRPKLTEYRKRMLATFVLNMAVVCFGVAMFEGKYWAAIPGTLFLYAFFYLTKGM